MIKVSLRIPQIPFVLRIHRFKSTRGFVMDFSKQWFWCRYYKNLTWVWGTDRKFLPEGSLFGITRLENSVPMATVWHYEAFLSTPNTHAWFFFLHTFRFQMFYFKSSIHYHTFEIWRHCESYMTSYTTNAQRIHLKLFFFFILPMGEITWVKAKTSDFLQSGIQEYCIWSLVASSFVLSCLHIFSLSI